MSLAPSPLFTSGAQEWSVRQRYVLDLGNLLGELRAEVGKTAPDPVKLLIPASTLEAKLSGLRSLDPEHSEALVASVRAAVRSAKTLAARLEQQADPPTDFPLLNLVKSPLLLETRGLVAAAQRQVTLWDNDWRGRVNDRRFGCEEAPHA